MITTRKPQTWVVISAEQSGPIHFTGLQSAMNWAREKAEQTPGTTYRVLKVVADYTVSGLTEELYCEDH